MEARETLLGRIDSFVWGPPLLILLVGTGIYFTIGLLGLSKVVFSETRRYFDSRECQASNICTESL